MNLIDNETGRSKIKRAKDDIKKTGTDFTIIIISYK